MYAFIRLNIVWSFVLLIFTAQILLCCKQRKGGKSETSYFIIIAQPKGKIGKVNPDL